MGYDITFHPIAKKDLIEKCLNVVIDPSLETQVSQELKATPEEIQYILQPIFSEMCSAKEKIMTTLRRIRSGENVGNENKQLAYEYGRIPFCCAAIAGFIHPYFYARSACLAFLLLKEPHFKQYVQSIYDIKPPFCHAGDKIAIYEPRMSLAIFILQNYSGGGYVAYEKLTGLKQALQNASYSKIVDQVFGTEIEGLMAVIEYCLQHQIGFIEASDVVVPIQDKFLSRAENFRPIWRTQS